MESVKTTLAAVIFGSMTMLSAVTMLTNYNIVPTINSLFVVNKFADGHDVFNSGADGDRAMADIFNQDNGTIYCVYKMNNTELAEFRVAFAGMFVTESFNAMFNNAITMQQLQDKPIQTLMRNTLQKKYPCNK